MRANCRRAFYFPKQQPMPNSYIPHYKFLLSSRINLERFCNRGRVKEMSVDTHMVCVDPRLIVESTENKKFYF